MNRKFSWPDKYRPYPSVNLEKRDWPNNRIESAPSFCAVDLRDGNQALINPLNLEGRKDYFSLLKAIGFKEFEACFPSASEIDYGFMRWLIEEDQLGDMIPQVLVQSRRHLIEKTFASLEGAREAIVHLYVPTSSLQRRVVFQKDRQEIIDIALEGVSLIQEKAKDSQSKIRLEFSPESFTGTELDFALEISKAVHDQWKPQEKGDLIINLPATVEMSTPNIYADQIEWFRKHFYPQASWTLSVHPHNDRGTAVAAAELALMAGADRVEGTLFGNGERTGNLDFITLAMNMHSQGLETGLEFGNINKINQQYEALTGLQVGKRHPYAGELVFTAFSGSHQDAIKKGMKLQSASVDPQWQVPYLPMDPADLGRKYEEVIRINSQSGKGGVAWVLERQGGYLIPKAMQPQIQAVVQSISDERAQEIGPEEIVELFVGHFMNQTDPFQVEQIHIESSEEISQTAQCRVEMKLTRGAKDWDLQGEGAGPVQALVRGLTDALGVTLKVLDYFEHAISEGAQAQAAAYIHLSDGQGTGWGAGQDENITMAGLKALISAFNRLQG